MNWEYFDPKFECDAYNKEMLKYSPWSGHRRFAYDLVVNKKPELIVELGSFYGCSYFAFAQAIKDHHLDSCLYGVDVWRAFEGDRFVFNDYSEEIWMAFCKVKDLCYPNKNCQALRMTFDEAIDSFEDNSIDILHIDGSHDYKDVRHDFETWKAKVKSSGMVLFHDIGNQRVYGEVMGSHGYWMELIEQYPTVTFEYSFGLGVLFFDDALYKEFKSSVDFSIYLDAFYQDEVDQKDEIRKQYFTKKNDDFKIIELERKCRDNQSGFEDYKRTIRGKDDFIEVLQERIKANEKASLKVTDEIKREYEETIAGKNRYIEELSMRIEKNKEVLKETSDTIKNAYEKTICEKDSYISSLETTLSSMVANPKISVIIPVYNTAAYLSRCLDSVVGQIYRNLEIIVVNDGSTDNAETVIEKYAASDPRIKYVKHEKNKGLFQARLSGSRISTGDYIAFLDSDDYVLKDFYYSLVKKAEDTGADIVIGRTIIETQDGRRELLHFHDLAIDCGLIDSAEIEENFWSYEGRCYAWHTIWNKLYSMELWRQAAPFYKNLTGHIVMTEDVAFSSVLVHFARRMASTNSSGYFYCEREEASTNSNKPNVEKYMKNVADMISVFSFVENFIKTQEISVDIWNHEQSFRKYYAAMWQNHGKIMFEGDDLKKILQAVGDLTCDFKSYSTDEYPFFDSLRIQWNDGLEGAKAAIMNPEVHYVSFDIFDTLIFRPVYSADKVFDLLDIYYAEITNDNVLFSKIRQTAENIVRRNIAKQNPGYEDITIDEIYDCVGSLLEITDDVIAKVKSKEIEIEMNLCQRRTKIGELFELASFLGKPIVLTSDMYLTRDIIEKILSKMGYCDYSELFVSSETRLLKGTGKLYEYVLDRLNISPNELVHFGDNWQSDIATAQEKGIRTFFVPKATELFENKINGRETNKCAFLEKYAAGWINKESLYTKSFGYGAMMAIVAERYFDNPYRVFFPGSDLNVDPYLVGYYPVAMHLFGFTKWLIENAQKLGYEKLCFLSRDGYLPFLTYKKICTLYKDAPKAIYKHASRKAMMPYIVKTKNDLYAYPTEIRAQNPIKMFKLLGFCAKEISEDEYKRIIMEEGIDPEENFDCEEKFYNYIKLFIDNFYDERKHNDAQIICSQYFSDIDSKTAMVDMGYSGRIQGAISNAVGFGVDVFFVHSDSSRYKFEEYKNRFQIFSFYDSTPCISGVFREYLFSGIEPSCIGYCKKNDDIECIYEKDKYGVADKWINKEIRRGVEDFINKYIESFGNTILQLSGKNHEISFPYEGYLRIISDSDIKMFEASFFEDDVWGGEDHINMAQFLLNQRNNASGSFIVVNKETDGKYVAKVKRIINRYPYIKALIEKCLDKV